MGLFDIFSTKDQRAAAGSQNAGINTGLNALNWNLDQGRGALIDNSGNAVSSLTGNYGLGSNLLQNYYGQGQGALANNYGAGQGALASNYGQASDTLGAYGNAGIGALTSGAGAGIDALSSGYGAGRGALMGTAAQGAGALNQNYSAGLMPYLQNYAQAQPGVTMYGNSLGLNGQAGSDAALSAFQNSNPGYQFMLDQGTQNVLRNQAATGQLNSGGTNLDLLKYGQGLANQTYGNWQSALSPYLNQANTAASGIGGLYSGLGSNLANLYSGLGSQLNASQQGQGQGVASIFGNLGSAINANDLATGANRANVSTGLGSAINNNNMALGNNSANLYSTEGNALNSNATTMGQNLSNIYSTLGSLLNNSYGTAGNAAYGANTSIGNNNAQADLAGLTASGNLMGLLGGILGLGANKAGNSAGTVNTGTPNTMANIGSGVGNFAGGLGSSLMGMLPKFAEGGRPTGPSIVGERGPELFVPDQPGTVVPSEALSSFDDRFNALHDRPAADVAAARMRQSVRPMGGRMGEAAPYREDPGKSARLAQGLMDILGEKGGSLVDLYKTPGDVLQGKYGYTLGMGPGDYTDDPRALPPSADLMGRAGMMALDTMSGVSPFAEKGAAGAFGGKLKGPYEPPSPAANANTMTVGSLADRIRQRVADNPISSEPLLSEFDQARLAAKQARSDQGMKEALFQLGPNPTPEQFQAWALRQSNDMPQGIKPQGIRAYHGSPHDFDRFDINKIGTGEGAQSYGHGLYFAEHEPVARSYKDAMRVTDMDWPISGTDLSVPAWVARSSKTPHGLEEVRNNFLGRLEESKKELAAGDWNANSRIYHQQKIIDALDAVKNGAELKQPGKMYEVNINAHPDQFLDWDKPLRDQPVADTIRSLVPSNMRKPFDENVEKGRITGSNVYNSWVPNQSFAIREHIGAPYAASGAKTFDEALQMAGGDPSRLRTINNPSREIGSQRLREAGVPGIKYLDQGSRGGTGTGTSNYVMFDDKLIDILRKYGIAGLTAGGAAGAGAAFGNLDDGAKSPPPTRKPDKRASANSPSYADALMRFAA